MEHVAIFLEKIASLDGSVSVLLAVLGATFVFWQYKQNFFEKQRQVVLVLRSKLDISEDWASARNQGYVGEPSSEQKLRYSNPFHFVNDIENAVVDELVLQPGVVNFDARFLGTLAKYNQTIRTIHSLISFQKSIVTSLSRESLNLGNELKELSGNADYEQFKKQQLPGLENDLSEKLVQINTKLHFDYIGSRESNGLKTLFHELEDGLKTHVKGKTIKQLAFFNSILLILVFFSAVSIVGFSGFNLSVERILYILLFIILVVYYSFERERQLWLEIVNEK